MGEEVGEEGEEGRQEKTWWEEGGRKEEREWK